MTPIRTLKFFPFLLLGLFMLVLGGCQDTLDSVVNKVEQPLPARLINKMKAHDMSLYSPIMMRIFKEEGILEVWKQKGNGRYDIIASYPICKWSGKLGPKLKEGDRQAPEGYYRIYPSQMNPNSRYYLSFNIGFPNSYDRSHGRTGSNLMVHGACSSAGCYSMTDAQVLEIYAFARDAFKGGQKYFLVEAFPFRMTAENMARHRKDPNFGFWQMLKIGYDHFELTKRPPKVDVCERRYVFDQIPDDPNATFNPINACPPASVAPSLAMAYASYQKIWNADFAKAAAKFEKEDARKLKAEQVEAVAEAKAEAKAEAWQQEREAKKAARVATNHGRSSFNPIASLFAIGRSAENSKANADQAVPITPEPAVTTDGEQSSHGVQNSAPIPAAKPSVSGGVPVPVPNPAAQSTNVRPAAQDDKPFWKIWSRH